MKTFSIATTFCALIALVSCGYAAPKTEISKQQGATKSATSTQSVTWNPLEKQEREPDTLFLLDMDEEAKWKPGEGGLIPGNPLSGAQLKDKVAIVDGKFRKGLKSITRDYGYAWLPSLGLMPPDEFTVEYWFKSDVPMETFVNGRIPLSIFNGDRSVSLECSIYENQIHVQFTHNQSATGIVDMRMAYDLKAHPLAANVWHNIAYTFKNGTFRFYVNGVLAGEAKDLPAPRIWNDGVAGDGISLAGGVGIGSEALSISDLRISRFARAPGEKTVVSDSNVLTVSSTPTGEQINQNLRGGLHYFLDAKTGEMGKGVLKFMRTDKLLTATPIKAGAPDATHPTKGVSGKYSYDWQVVDRTLDYYKKLGVTPYLSIDSTPEILGGKTPPFSGAQLANPEAKTGWSGFTPEVPNDMAAFGVIVQDLVNHVIKERRDNVPYWGVWNEPGGDFFSGSVADYLKVYDECAAAVKGVDPNLKIGGPESAEFNGGGWTEALIKHCAQTKTPLDFVSWHYYSGQVTEFQHVKNQVAAWSKQYGLAQTPALINGEWTWQANNLYHTGWLPFSAYHYHLNDYNASFVSASLVEMQNAGVLLSIFTNPVATDTGTGWDSSGLFSPDHSWATGNVFRLWSKLAPDILHTEYSGVPGVWQIASRDKNGRITIFLTRMAYRKDAAPLVTIKLPGVPANAKITDYLIDDAHSNAIDAGIEHAELETVPSPKLAGGQMRIALRGRSTHLLVIEPAAK